MCSRLCVCFVRVLCQAQVHSLVKLNLFHLIMQHCISEDECCFNMLLISVPCVLSWIQTCCQVIWCSNSVGYYCVEARSYLHLYSKVGWWRKTTTRCDDFMSDVRISQTDQPGYRLIVTTVTSFMQLKHLRTRTKNLKKSRWVLGNGMKYIVQLDHISH